MHFTSATVFEILGHALRLRLKTLEIDNLTGRSCEDQNRFLLEAPRQYLERIMSENGFDKYDARNEMKKPKETETEIVCGAFSNLSFQRAFYSKRHMYNSEQSRA